MLEFKLQSAVFVTSFGSSNWRIKNKFKKGKKLK